MRLTDETATAIARRYGIAEDTVRRIARWDGTRDEYQRHRGRKARGRRGNGRAHVGGFSLEWVS